MFHRNGALAMGHDTMWFAPLGIALLAVAHLAMFHAPLFLTIAALRIAIKYVHPAHCGNNREIPGSPHCLWASVCARCTLYGAGALARRRWSSAQLLLPVEIPGEAFVVAPSHGAGRQILGLAWHWWAALVIATALSPFGTMIGVGVVFIVLEQLRERVGEVGSFVGSGSQHGPPSESQRSLLNYQQSVIALIFSVLLWNFACVYTTWASSRLHPLDQSAVLALPLLVLLVLSRTHMPPRNRSRLLLYASAPSPSPFSLSWYHEPTLSRQPCVVTRRSLLRLPWRLCAFISIIGTTRPMSWPLKPPCLLTCCLLIALCLLSVLYIIATFAVALVASHWIDGDSSTQLATAERKII